MGSISPELSLDYKPAAYIPKTITGFLRDLSMIGNGNISEKLSKLDDYIQRLEEEKNKIDAFKRELPLSMILLNDAIESLKDERIHIRPVMEEFVLLKRDSNEEGEMNKEEECCDKKNWMSSVQLWTSNGHPNSNNIKHSDEEDDDSAIENPVQPCQYKNGVGAFMPFNGCSSFPMKARNEDKGNSNFPVLSRKEDELVPDLSLLTPGIKTPTRTEQSLSGFSSKSNGSSSGDVPSSSTNAQSHVQRMETQQQPCRKQRRCWSPELHRRFVSALQQLGGSQVATPKQIRELMKVDGLTNDEVKSHLQKYRLHTRRHLSTTSPADQSEVVLKRLWMHQDQYGALSKQNISQSSSPQGPLQLAGTAGGISATGCDSMEDEEDGRSESYSWKGHLHKEGDDV